MRFAIAVAVACGGAACHFGPGPTGGGDDVVPPGSHEEHITDDTFADLGTHARLVDGTVATRGALEPDAFVWNGLRARVKRDDNYVADNSTWGQLDGLPIATDGFAWGQVPADWQGGHPRGLQLAKDEDFTVIYDGDLLVPAGDSTLFFHGDDYVFLEYSLDGGATYEPALHSHNSDVSSPTISFAAPTWIPIHAAFGEDNGQATFRFEIHGSGAPITVDATRLRARVSQQLGLRAQVFADRQLVASIGTGGLPTIDASYGGNAPQFDFAQGVPADGFAVRYIGQLLVDTDDMYTFSAELGIQPTDGNHDLFRIYVDGALVADYWAAQPSSTGTVHLAPGWHDLVVDHADISGDAQIAVYLHGATEEPHKLDASHLRPGGATGAIASYYSQNTNGYINGGQPVQLLLWPPPQGTLPAPPVLPAGAVIDSVDYGVYMNVAIANVGVTLFDCTPAGHTPTVLLLPYSTPYYYYATGDRTCAGQPVPTDAAPWKLAVGEGAGGTGNATLVGAPDFSVMYHGGDQYAFAPAFTFESRAHETPKATEIGKIHVTADLRGAAMTLFVRTAASADALSGEDGWVPVAEGEPAAVEPSAFVQYKISVVSDGWTLPSIDTIVLDYAASD